MYLIVGLGNKGKEYNNTRHNIGFKFIDELAKKYNVSISKKKLDGMYAEININGEKVILLKPQLYMNLSGITVKKYMSFFKIPVENILIIQDDLDMEVGTLKLKTNSSSGGHNGIKNIEDELNTNAIKRLKIGISNTKEDTIEYVLGKFSKQEQEVIDNLSDTVVSILEEFPTVDFERLMNKYN